MDSDCETHTFGHCRHEMQIQCSCMLKLLCNPLLHCVVTFNACCYKSLAKQSFTEWMQKPALEHKHT